MEIGSDTAGTTDGQQVVRPTVFVIEDDPGAREATVDLLRQRGFRCSEFSSAEGFLASGRTASPGCVVLDYQLPGINGLELQERLLGDAQPLPVVVTTAHANVPAAVKFMERGAVTLIEKPYRPDDLASAIVRAIHLSEVQDRVRRRYESISASIELLSPRERTVLHAMVEGQLNKAIARSLEVSVRTIEGDRAKIVDKFGAETTGEVVGKYAQYSLLNELGLLRNSFALRALA